MDNTKFSEERSLGLVFLKKNFYGPPDLSAEKRPCAMRPTVETMGLSTAVSVVRNSELYCITQYIVFASSHCAKTSAPGAPHP